MPNIRLIVEYNGFAFHGWQKQPLHRTIQGELERVLCTVLREKVGPLHASGRTDAGVHARAQVVTFRVAAPPDLYRLASGVSHLMKGELAVLSAEIVADDFHPGHCATHKQYCYTILHRAAPAVLDAGRVWHISHALDLELLKRCAPVVVGTHDFSSFRDSGCTATTPVKTIYSSEVEVDGAFIRYRVVGSGFLKQMVRNLVGTLTDIARGRIRDRTMQEILLAKDRRIAGITAPAHGLCLDWVGYGAPPSLAVATENSVETEKDSREALE